MKRFFFLSVILFVLVPNVQAGGDSSCAANPPASLMNTLLDQAPGLTREVLRLALEASNCAAQRGLLKRRDLLTVIDYSIASSEPRMFIFDLSEKKLLFRELVAHGKNSGGDRPDRFSNEHGSLATSLGLFVTADTYNGSNGYSLRLRGLEDGVNDQALNRAIVMHGASYVSKTAVRVLGRLGRSWGCPAVRAEIADKIIDKVRGGSALFAYYPDKNWLSSSAFLPKTRG